MLHGRELEQAEIDRLLARTSRGEGEALALCGEPGIGKSSLLHYARERVCRSRKWIVPCDPASDDRLDTGSADIHPDPVAMIPAHDPGPRLLHRPLPPRPPCPPPEDRSRTSDRGSRLAPPAPRPRTPGPSASLPTDRPSAPERPEPHASAPGLEVLAGQPGDVAALAPGAGPLEVGALRPATSTRSTWPEPRAPGADCAPCPREPEVGISPHPGRAPEARLPLLSRHRAQCPAAPRTPACPAPRPALLARVRPPARRADPDGRLLYGGDGLAPAPSRALLFGDRQPLRPSGWLHRLAHRRLGGPAGPSAGLATPRWQAPGPHPAPRSGLQVHVRVRRSL